MPSFVTVTSGATAQAQDVNQIILALNGTAGSGISISLTALNDSVNFALAVKNADPTNSRSLQVLRANNNVLIQADANGVIVSPDGGASTGKVATQTLAETWANKILTSPHFTSPVIDSGALTLAATGIITPASTDLILSPGSGGVVRPNLNYVAVNSSANTAVAAGTTVDLNPGLLFTLAAGTWLLLGHWVALDTSAAANLMTGYIRDGANTVIATHTNTAVASGYGGGPLVAVVTPAVSTGYKISVNATGNATAQSGTSSGLVAIRFA